MLKWRDAFFNFAGSAWMCPRFLSLSLWETASTSLPPLAFLWQPLAHAWLSHHTLAPLLLVFPPSHSLSLSLSSTFPLPLSMWLVSCVWQWCHYWAARITLSPMGCLSALPLSLSPPLFLPSLLSLSIPLLVSCPWRLCVTFIPKTRCPSQTLPIMPCVPATYLHPLQLVPITKPERCE